MNNAVQSYEKQCARDKMIVKFREDRISKLEQAEPKESKDERYEKQVRTLKQEISLLKESVESNSKAAKIHAEKEVISNKLKDLQSEVTVSPDSLSAQLRNQSELVESLNQYVKLYGEENKRQIEQEMSKTKLEYAEKIETLNEQVQDLKAREETAT
jgi:hypothetical protein